MADRRKKGELREASHSFSFPPTFDPHFLCCSGFFLNKDPEIWRALGLFWTNFNISQLKISFQF
jgi:hypothetical protein